MPACVRWLVVVNVAVFLVQMFLSRRPAGEWLMELFSLSGIGLRHGYVWQLVTYAFLHGSPTHLLMNVLGLLFLGPQVEWELGRRHFLSLYALSVVLGGLGFVLIEPVAVCVGASAGVFGVMAAFAAMHPRRKMVLLFLPFFPMPAWVLVLGIALIEVVFLLTGTQAGVANSAHLAGALAGFVYVRALSRSWQWMHGLRELGSRFGRSKRAWTMEEGATAGNVDRILDKVAREGLTSLSRREQEILEQASRERGAP